MDKRLKQMMISGLFNEEAAKAACEVDAADDFDFDAQVSALSDDFIGRIKKCLEKFDENAFLYLGGYVTLPEIGESFVIRQGGEDVECVVEAVNITTATITLKHYVPKSLYFKTAEQATTYTNTGNKGNYSDWDNSPSETYQYEGEHMVEKYEELSFDRL